jgi:hypothetical protein
MAYLTRVRAGYFVNKRVIGPTRSKECFCAESGTYLCEERKVYRVVQGEGSY